MSRSKIAVVAENSAVPMSPLMVTECWLQSSSRYSSKNLTILKSPRDGSDSPGAGCRTVLGDQSGDHRPALAQLPGCRNATAGHLVLVEVVLDDIGVVPGVGEVASEHVVDIAALLGGEGRDAHRESIGERDVDVAAQVVAWLAAAHGIGAGIDLAAESAGVGLVGDDAQRAGLGAGSE